MKRPWRCNRTRLSVNKSCNSMEDRGRRSSFFKSKYARCPIRRPARIISRSCWTWFHRAVKNRGREPVVENRGWDLDMLVDRVCSALEIHTISVSVSVRNARTPYVTGVTRAARVFILWNPHTTALTCLKSSAVWNVKNPRNSLRLHAWSVALRSFW